MSAMAHVNKEGARSRSGRAAIVSSSRSPNIATMRRGRWRRGQSATWKATSASARRQMARSSGRG